MPENPNPETTTEAPQPEIPLSPQPEIPLPPSPQPEIHPPSPQPELFQPEVQTSEAQPSESCEPEPHNDQSNQTVDSDTIPIPGITEPLAIRMPLTILDFPKFPHH